MKPCKSHIRHTIQTCEETEDTIVSSELRLMVRSRVDRSAMRASRIDLVAQMEADNTAKIGAIFGGFAPEEP